MKHYLWAGVVLLFIGAHASDNPFAIEENFGKLEKEQEVLLDKLRKLAEAKEFKQEQEAENEPVKEKTSEVVDIPTIEDKEPAEKLEKIRQNALEVSKKEAEEREVLLAEAKAKEAEIQKIKEEEQKRLEVAKKEAEALEVEAYEKARADRREKEEAAEKKIIENKEIAIVKNLEDESTSIDDINITKEKLEEKLKADEEYAQAVKEMGEEE